MRQETGNRVLETLGLFSDQPPGPVIADPRGVEPRMYFLVPVSTAAGWDVPGTRALGRNHYLVVPGASRTSPPGLHWAVPPSPPGAEPALTGPRVLRAALEAMVAVR